MRDQIISGCPRHIRFERLQSAYFNVARQTGMFASEHQQDLFFIPILGMTRAEKTSRRRGTCCVSAGVELRPDSGRRRQNWPWRGHSVPAPGPVLLLPPTFWPALRASRRAAEPGLRAGRSLRPVASQAFGCCRPNHPNILTA